MKIINTSKKNGKIKCPICKKTFGPSGMNEDWTVVCDECKDDLLSVGGETLADRRYPNVSS